MIYVETILDERTEIKIERQRALPDGDWYGLCILQGGTDIADNEYWIGSVLDRPRKCMMSELGISKEVAKDLRKVMKKARKLGWF